jgi:hypothetical protein
MAKKRTFEELLNEVQKLADESKAISERVSSEWIEIEKKAGVLFKYEDLDKLDNLYFEGIDGRDYPDFVDAYLSNANFNDKELTTEELDYINENYTDWVYEELQNFIY